ncbi:GerMN domain-containing protein [bacterium]|nr:GerMN domain-containing protein [bacterium]
MIQNKKRTRQKQENFLFFLMGIILLGLLISGYFLFVGKILPGISSSGTKIPSSNHSESKKTTLPSLRDDQGNEQSGQAMNLYFAAKGQDKLVKEIRRISTGEKTIIAIAINLINELIRGPFSPEARPLISPGSQLRALFFHKGIFYVDFSREFIENHPGGAQEEVLTIYSIVNTLTELDSKAKVKFLVNGTEIDSLRGHVALRQFITRFDSLL